MSKSYIEESRRPWYRGGESQPTNDDLHLGCLQRIAAALEKLASPWESIDREKRWKEQAQQAAEYLKRRLAAQKGATTRAKRRAGR